MPDEKPKPELNFRRPGGLPGSFHGSPFNQFKKLSRYALTDKFRYERFKAFLEEFYVRHTKGEALPDLAAEVFPVFIHEGFVTDTTFKIDILHWLHEYTLFRRGEAEFECPSQIP